MNIFIHNDVSLDGKSPMTPPVYIDIRYFIHIDGSIGKYFLCRELHHGKSNINKSKSTYYRSTRHPVGSFQRRKDLKRLLIYMSYGWGSPMLLTLIVYIFSLKKVLPESIQPYIGHTKCLIDSSKC